MYACNGPKQPDTHLFFVNEQVTDEQQIAFKKKKKLCLKSKHDKLSVFITKRTLLYDVPVWIQRTVVLTYNMLMLQAQIKSL